jgi:hypothetical protein
LKIIIIKEKLIPSLFAAAMSVMLSVIILSVVVLSVVAPKVEPFYNAHLFLSSF